MQSWLSAGETYVRKSHHCSAFGKYFLQEIDRKEIGGSVIERILIAETIAAMKIANICQLNAEAAWTIAAPA
jgi:hypothetical protein